MSAPKPTSKRGLSRDAIVARALELGKAEGLESVTVRRLAGDFGVTPMALYRHFQDKQDLVNAMTEKALAGLDVKVGFTPSMSWTDRLRRAMENFKREMEERPLALALSIAYTGNGPPEFWRMTEDLLEILLDAGFARRHAMVLIRVVSNLLSGYLLLLRQDDPSRAADLGPREVELLRRQFELVQLALPEDQFPNLVAGAHDLADVWLSHPDRWWADTEDLMVFGLEALLRSQASRGR
jgi:TetR/AcrR family tetracycline transcriptional repressor